MFQTNQITRLAVVVFKEEGQIKISGEGMLKKMFLSAYLSEDRLQIQPPREHYYFNRNGHAELDTALLRKVSTYFIISDTEAEEIVRSWETSIKKKASEAGVRFGEYGTFRFEGQFDFDSESLYYYQWLPSLRYRSPGADIEEYPLMDRVPAAALPPHTSKRKRRVLIPALWGVFACLFAFSLFFWSEPINLIFDQNPPMDSRLVNVAPESYRINESIDYFSDTHDMGSIPSSSKNESIEESQDIVSDADDEPNSLQSGNQFSDSENEAGLDAKENEIAALPDADHPTVSPRCKLVLGAFANPANVNRMVSKLDDFGVDVITMDRKTLTLVAAKVNCSDQSSIDRLRDQIEPNAWIYKK